MGILKQLLKDDKIVGKNNKNTFLRICFFNFSKLFNQIGFWKN